MGDPAGTAVWRTAAAVVAVVLALAPGCSGGNDGTAGLLAAGERLPGGITVTSTAFDHGAPVPERFSCEGENVPPPLRWAGVPAGTTEVAVVVEDPDAPDGIFVHWLVVGIDPGTTSIDPTGPVPGRELPGSSENPTYIGPCPPDGDGSHRYFFQVYALPGPFAPPAGGGPLEHVRAVRRAASAGGVLRGTFER